MNQKTNFISVIMMEHSKHWGIIVTQEKSLRESLSEPYIDKISTVDKIISYIITIIFCFAVIQSITLTIIH